MNGFHLNSPHISSVTIFGRMVGKTLDICIHMCITFCIRCPPIFLLKIKVNHLILYLDKYCMYCYE
jgi:hypothetical protein